MNAQVECDHLTLDYNVSSSYFALGVSNQRLEESEFVIEIERARYQLDGTMFTNSNGIQLEVESSQNQNGTYNYTLTPDQPIGSYQYLNFVYNGVPPNTGNNYSANAEVLCSFAYVPLCVNLEFNYFNEAQYSLGFSVQNNNSTPYYPYEIHIDNATYNISEAQLSYEGFDYYKIINGNGTYDYYFLAQEPIEGYSSSPRVSSSQNLGNIVSSNGANIQCGDEIVSSGFSGGLESHGGLASKIALRNFKQAIGKKTTTTTRNDNTIISNLVPEHILANDQLIESSPNDLVEITAAEKIWAGDYYINNNRFASIFGSKTSDEVYDHTKVICDRVKGSELAAVELVNIDGYETILSIIRRPNNSLEYAISFSLAYKDYGDFTMASHWALDEYKTSPNFLNYQVWTNSKAKSIAAVQHIINKVVSENGFTLSPASTSPSAPKLFARRAHYRLGAFHLELNNRLTEATTVTVSGTCTNKEIDGENIQFNQELEITPGQTTLKLDLPSGNIFDGEISLKTANDQKDVIYMADGSWGLEYEKLSTTVDHVEILSDNRTEIEGEYLVERGISVQGNTDSYISIFKQLIPGGLAVDLSEYNTLSFDSHREGAYEVTLLTAGNTDPSLNFSHTLKTQADSSVNIPFALFENSIGEQLDASKITTIYIAFKESDNDQKNFDFTIENIRFNTQEESNLIFNQNIKLNLFPNPSNGVIQLTHNFEERTEAQITVYDTKGAIIKEMTMTAFEGLQRIELNIEQQGLFVVSLQTNEGTFTNTILVDQ